MILAGIGRYGPYVQHGSVFANLPEVEEVFTVGLNRAVDVLAEKAAKGPGRFQRGAAPAGKVLGDFPDGGPVTLRDGRFGPYVNWTKVNATLPKALNKDTLTLEQAIDLIRAKQASDPASARPARGAKSASKPAKTKAEKPKAEKAGAQAKGGEKEVADRSSAAADQPSRLIALEQIKQHAQRLAAR